MKGKMMLIKPIILLFVKHCPKNRKNNSKSYFARANENLVGPLSIVLNQSCVNIAHYHGYQMKEENHILPCTCHKAKL